MTGRTTDGAAGARIAERTGIPESTISRWLSEKAEPRPRQVVTVTRAYGANPIEGLIAAGYLTEDEIEAPQPRRLQIRDFTDIELAEETLRRIREGNAPVLEAPYDENHPAMNGTSEER